MSKLTLVVDSSQIACFLECPTKWYYEYCLNLTPAALPPNEPMLKGTYGHKLMDIYYKFRVTGHDIVNSIEAAMEWNPDLETCECGHSIVGHWQPAGVVPSIRCKTCDCGISKPIPFPLHEVGRHEVKQRFREYCYTYCNNDFQPTSPEHVEVGFSEPIYESSDRLYVLEGRIDLLGTLQGLNCAADHKFQMRTHSLYKKSIQFRNYAMVTHTNMFVINYVRLTKGISKDTFVRDIASFTPVEHDVWKQRLIRVFDQMLEARIHDNYEQRWESCSGRYGYPCVFTPLCEEWDRSLIQLKRDQMYVQKQEWKPW